jgi:hypothetical protein
MEISIPLQNVNTQYIYFTEKKKNVIVDGNFIKLIYSTSGFEMTGLYIAFDIKPTQHYTFNPASILQMRIRDDQEWKSSNNAISRSYTEKRRIPEKLPKEEIWTLPSHQLPAKRTITFDPYLEHNYKIINQLCSIERDIIERYTAGKYRTKIASYILKTQLLRGSIKFHSECKDVSIKNRDSAAHESNANKVVLKISGIWETETNIGITMKFMVFVKP